MPSIFSTCDLISALNTLGAYMKAENSHFLMVHELLHYLLCLMLKIND